MPTFIGSGPPRSRHLLGALGDGIAGALPGRESSVHLDHPLESHLLGGVAGQGRAPRAVAVEDELLARGEDVLVVGALRVDPELQHPARAMERARDHPFPLQLADVAQIDEDDVVSAESGPRLVEGNGPDPRLRLVDQLPESLLELHRYLRGAAAAAAPPSYPRRSAGVDGGANRLRDDVEQLQHAPEIVATELDQRMPHAETLVLDELIDRRLRCLERRVGKPEAERDLDRLPRPPRGLGRRAQLGEPVAEVGDGARRSVPAVAEGDHATEGARAVAADPQRWVRPLRGLRCEADVAEPEELPVERRIVLRPQRLEHA